MTTGPDASPRWRPDALPIFLLVGVALAFFREAIFTDRTLYFRDVTTLFYPTRRLVADLVRAGELPLWNPYLESGVPLAADVVTNVFYPGSLVYYVLPFDLGFKWFVLGHFPLAGVSMYLLARRWGASRGGAFFAGLAFMLSGPLLSLASVVNFLPGMAWLPFVVLGVDRAIRRPSRWTITWAGVALALPALSDPQMAYLGGVTAVVYGLCLLGRPWGRALSRTAAVLGGIGTLAVLLAAIQLLPLAELYRESVRAGGLSLSEASQGAVALHRLVELVLPRLFGDPAAWTYWGGLTRAELTPWLLSPYLGLPTLVLAALGVLAGRRERVVWFLAALLAVSGMLALGQATPVHRLAFETVPLYRAFRYPAKWWLLVTFAVTALSALGFTALAELRATPRARRGLALVGGVVGASLILGALAVLARPTLMTPVMTLLVPGEIPPGLAHFARQRAVAQGMLAGGLLCASALCLVLVERSVLSRRGVEAGLVLLLLIDLLLNQRQLVPVAPASLHGGTSPLGRALSQDPELFRMSTMTRDWEFPPREMLDLLPRGVRYHAWVVEGLYPNTGLRDRLYEEGGSTAALLRDYSTLREAYGQAGRALEHLALWNVKYVLSLRARDTPLLEPVAVPPLAPPVRVYRHIRALPRAWVVPRAQWFGEREAMLRYMTGQGFDPRREVLLERREADTVSGVPGAWQAEVIAAEPNTVEVAVTTEGGGYLVLADTYYPGWRVAVDGARQALLRGNYAMRAVWVRPGAHRVRFEYRPWSVGLGAAISLATCGGVLAIAARRRFRPR